MPRTCTICSNDSKEAIDRALVEGTALSEVAALFRVSDDALSRHKANHLPATLSKAQEAEVAAEADELLDQVRGLQARTLAILEAAEGSSQHRTALSAIREARSNLELLAKLVGELDERPVNVLISPQWIEVRGVLLEALAPYPDARSAVAGRLLALEAG